VNLRPELVPGEVAQMRRQPTECLRDKKVGPGGFASNRGPACDHLRYGTVSHVDDRAQGEIKPHNKDKSSAPDGVWGINRRLCCANYTLRPLRSGNPRTVKSGRDHHQDDNLT
jgi:hypothetical protein